MKLTTLLFSFSSSSTCQQKRTELSRLPRSVRHLAFAHNDTDHIQPHSHNLSFVPTKSSRNRRNMLGALVQLIFDSVLESPWCTLFYTIQAMTFCIPSMVSAPLLYLLGFTTIGPRMGCKWEALALNCTAEIQD